MRFRAIVLAASDGVSHWARGDLWHKGDSSAWAGVRPLRFGSLDSFQNFLEALHHTPWLPDARNEVSISTAEGNQLVARGAAEWVATRSETLRSNISVILLVPEVGKVDLQFSTNKRGRIERPRCVSEIGFTSPDDLRDWACQLLDSHTVRATRRDWKAGRQVVDPINMADDLAERKSHRLTLRSSTFGAVAGLLAGIVAQYAGWALGR